MVVLSLSESCNNAEIVMKNQRIGLALAIALLMFPQIGETIYSPALTHIARGFAVDAEQAGKTLSWFFFAFAIGVVVWGRTCDQFGRRPTMLAGLSVYGAGSVLALYCQRFEWLLFARLVTAFGASVGSVGTQTMLRDSYQGEKLAHAFALVGIALALSPAIGMATGTLLTLQWGYSGVFTFLALVALVLLLWCALDLPETRPAQHRSPPLLGTLLSMLRDLAIWRSALLVALFNVSVFSYYQLAPFLFQRLDLPASWYGYSSLVLALGVGLGNGLNKRLTRRGLGVPARVFLATIIGLTGAVLVTALETSIGFLLPMLLIVMAFGLAIPNILATALNDYADRRGTAGALLGLLYYLLIAGGLALAGWGQDLGGALLCCALLALPLAASACVSRSATTTR